MFITCPCDKCGQNVEFSSDDFQESSRTVNNVVGQTIKCPHCGKDTALLISRPAGPPPTFRPPVVNSPPAHGPVVKPNPNLGVFGIVFLCLVGMGLIFMGGVAEARAQSVMHQIYGAIQYCTGFLLMGVALLINVIVRKT
jgi:NAD-dependent SIR2 family protein deacetylase